MLKWIRTAGLALAVGATGVSAQSNQEMLLEVMARHGVQLPNRDFERGFDEGMMPSSATTAGSLATPLAVMQSATGADRQAAAFAFGILAGRSGRGAAPQELAAAGQVLVAMLASADRRDRVAGARVGGRLFAVPLDAGTPSPSPPGMVDALFALLNREAEIELLAAMDAMGLLRLPTAVTALTERYHFYRSGGRRALAGGALEALARIGDPSTQAIVRALAGDAWCDGRDPTALVCAFARERMLQDGSAARIRAAADERPRRAQARGYLAELGLAVP